MKHKSALSVVILFSVSVLSGFGQIKQDRDVPDFNEVALSIHGDLYITQGNTRKVEIEASEKTLELIKTEVNNGVLHIKFEKWNVSSTGPITIWITAPNYSGLYLSGSGKITAEEGIESDEMVLKISGSGKINLNELKAEEVEASISGSGDMILKGSAKEMGISISGSGDILGDSFTVGEGSIRISGSGGCKIDVTDELEVRISGSGSVYYTGNPKIDASISGSGKVKSGE